MTNELAWGIAVLTAAALDDDGALESMMRSKLDEGPEAFLTGVCGLAQIGVVFALRAASNEGRPVEDLLQEVGLVSMQAEMPR